MSDAPGGTGAGEVGEQEGGGRSRPTHGPLIVGAWQLSEGHRASPRLNDEVLDDLVRLVGMGFTTFDCADIYTGVETLLGTLRRRVRDDLGAEAVERLRIHTKLVPDRSRLASVDRRYVADIVERSIRRLGVERLDLVQFAWWDYDVPGWLEAVGWLDALRREGRVGAVGVTNFDAPRLRTILDAGIPVATSQVQYSALDHRPENGMVALCREREVGLLCYGSLAGGFLSDRYLGAVDPGTDVSNRSLTKYRLIIDDFGGWDAYQTLLSRLRAIADAHGATLAQVAVAYVLGRPGVTAAIVGMSRADRLLELRRAVGLRLGPDEVAAIDALAAAAPGPSGDCFELERVKDGPHASIMKYDLNRT